MTNRTYVESVERIVRRQFRKYPEILEYHIVPCVEFAQELSEKLEADEEITLLGAWMHDNGKIVYNRKPRRERNGHHVTGAKKARRILKGLKYPDKRIVLVEGCVLKHSSDSKYLPATVEERIVADSDALAHFFNLPRLLQQAYGRRGQSLEKGNQWLREKCDSLIVKMTIPYAIDLVHERYYDIQRLFLR